MAIQDGSLQDLSQIRAMLEKAEKNEEQVKKIAEDKVKELFTEKSEDVAEPLPAPSHKEVSAHAKTFVEAGVSDYDSFLACEADTHTVKALQDLNDTVYLTDFLMRKTGRSYGGVKSLGIWDKWENAVSGLKVAMTTGGEGADWIPTGFSNQLMEAIESEKIVSSLIQSFDQPTNPYAFPLSLKRDQVAQTSSGEGQNTAGSTSVDTSALTLTAQTVVAWADFSDEVEEDSIIAIAPFVLSQLAMAHARAREDALINGQSSATTLEDSVPGGSAIAAPDVRVAFDGMRGIAHECGLKASAGTDAFQYDSSAGPFEKADYLLLLQQMSPVYARRPSDLMLVTSPLGAILILRDMTDFQDASKIANPSTLMTGEIGKLFGVPVIVSDQVRDTHTDGIVSATSANNVHASYILTHRPSWVWGNRSSVRLEEDRDPKAGLMTVVARERYSLGNFWQDGTSTADRNVVVAFGAK